MTTIPSLMPQQSDHTASSTVILVERRPQSLAVGDPCGALGIDPVAQPGSGAMMPLRVRCDPQLLDKMMQREHRDEATGVLPATFLNEAIRQPFRLSPRIGHREKPKCQPAQWNGSMLRKASGFIQPDDGSKDVFVHISAVERAALDGLNEGQKVGYEIEAGRQPGKTSAVNLKSL